MAARQGRFGVRVFLPLDELPTKVNEPHLPDSFAVSTWFCDHKSSAICHCHTKLHVDDSKLWTQGKRSIQTQACDSHSHAAQSVKTQLWMVPFYAQQSIIDKASICGKNITKLKRILPTSGGNIFLLLAKSEAMWLNPEELRFKAEMLFWKPPSEVCNFFFFSFF